MNFSLYGLDNFYYRRFKICCFHSSLSLYGLDNFYYRRLLTVSKN